MSLDSLVNVSITSTSVTVQQTGFGLPMILSANATFPERFRTYSDVAGLVTDGFAVDSPEYLSAQSMLSQEPSPALFGIGRLTLAPTQVYVIDITSVVADTDYNVTIEGEGVTTTTVTVDSASLTDTAIASALAILLNGVTGANFTAVASGTAVTCTGDAAGNYFSLEIDDVNRMEIQQTHVDPGVATDLVAIADEDDSWFFIINPYNSEAMISSIAAYAEANDKLFVAATNDSRSISVTAGSSDPLDDLLVGSYAATAGFYHPSPASFADAAFVGKNAPENPGSVNWNYRQLAGVPATKLTTTHKSNLESKNANYYSTIAGVNVTGGEGKTAANEYIDVVRGLAWLTARIQEGIFALQVGAKKIPYTDDGVTLFQSVVQDVLDLGVDRGVLSSNPAPVVTVPSVANVSAADKAGRILRDLNFTGVLSGAINKLVINGTISV